MKKTLLISCILCVSISYGQTWQAAGTGMNGNVFALYTYDSLLFAGGTFTSAGSNPANDIAQWNNSTWAPLGEGVNGSVNAITSYNGKLYVGGKFDSAGGIAARNIAMWNGTTWAALGKGVNDTVKAFIVLNGNLYVGGCFDSADGLLVNSVAEWNGVSWDSLGGGVNGHVYAFTNYGSNIIAGGLIDTANIFWTTNNYMQEWNGINWIGFGDSSTNFCSHPVYAITYFEDALFCGGTLGDTTGGRESSYFTNWVGDGANAGNATIWSEPGGPDAPIYAMAVYDSILYLGGRFDTTYGWPTKCIASCSNDTGWSAWDTVGGGLNNTVYALAVYNGQLYAGGAFTQYYQGINHSSKSKGYAANHIATYKSPKPTSVNTLVHRATFKVYPNPFTTTCTVLFSESGTHYLELDDITGRKLRTVESTDKQYELNRDGIAQGMYLLKIFDRQMKYESSLKLVIQ